MKKKDILIEIGCEDLPSWSEKYFNERWIPVFTLLLEEYKIGYGEVRFFTTPRRLILFIKSVSPKQQDMTMEIYGPPAEIAMDRNGDLTPVAEKFARSHNVDTKHLLIRERKGKKVLVVAKHEKGKQTTEVIGEVLRESVNRLEIPRGMKWNGGDFKFLRPIRWITAFYGTKPLKISLGGVKSGNFSYGHRTLAPSKLKISSSVDYIDKILKNFVIFDPEVRFEYAKTEIIRKTGNKNFTFDEEHLKKVIATAEYPVIEVCELKEEHMEIPQKVVSAVIMALNGIPLSDKDGRLSKRYIAIFDGTGGEEIKTNYQNVLYAKMEDAVFFIEKDLQTKFNDYTERLKNIAYHPKWGSMYERVQRFHKIYEVLTRFLDFNVEEKANIKDIINLCKNDLSTLMVTEFPSLEGVIGRVYAEKQQYNSTVGAGIEQHYWPRFSGDALPQSREASIVSVIVRIETICGFLLSDVEVKGSGDPYGLKKVTNGMMEIIWEKNLDFSIREVIGKTLEVFGHYSPESEDKIMDFILQRVDNLFAVKDISPGIRKAVMSVNEENFVIQKEKIDALENFFKTGSAKNLLVPFIRIANILKQANEKNIAFGDFEESLLMDETEKQLFSFYKENMTISELLEGETRDYKLFIQQLGKWRKIIDKFFDDVLVMSDDVKLRNNRLALLKKINDLFLLFADFSLIPIVEVEDA